MRNLILSLVTAAALVGVSAPAHADDRSDRAAAIELCRSEVAARAGVDAETVQFDAVRVRPRLVRVDLDLWRGGELTNVRCEVSRGGELAIVAVEPALQQAQATAQ